MRTLAAGAIALLLAGCGQVGPSTSPPGPHVTRPHATQSHTTRPHVTRPTDVPAAQGLVKTRWPATVLDAGRPELCLGVIADSLPPQCSGIPVVNWDWSEHDGDYEESGKTRWGTFLLTGTFDGTSFTTTRVSTGEGFDYPTEPLPGTPCAEPDGGWRVLDPDKTTEVARDRAGDVARHLDGFAAIWVDQSINPAFPFVGRRGEVAANDPTKLVLDVAMTRDLVGAEQAIRAVWGGALCVTRYEHTDAELERIQAQASDLPGMLVSGGGDARDHVTLSVVHDDGSIQKWCDQRWGRGVVDVTSALVPASEN